jgi:hypothetical protein
MKTKTQNIPAITLLIFALTAASGVGQVTSFNYTGCLLDGGSPASGSNDLQFTLYVAPSGGAPLAGSITITNQPVNNGVFVVSLDFGDVFDGSTRWLEISARPGGSANEFSNTFPRQAITAAPYAINAFNGVPVGTILPFHTFGGKAAIPLGWQICDGSLITNSASPLLGELTPNLVGRFLKGATNSGTSGGSISTGARDGGTDLNTHKHESAAITPEHYWGNDAPFGTGGSRAAAGACNAGVAKSGSRPIELTNIPYNTDLNAHTHSVDPLNYAVLFIVRIR